LPKKKNKTKKPRVIVSEPITLSKVIHKNVQTNTVPKRKHKKYIKEKKKKNNLIERILWQK